MVTRVVGGVRQESQIDHDGVCSSCLVGVEEEPPVTTSALRPWSSPPHTHSPLVMPPSRKYRQRDHVLLEPSIPSSTSTTVTFQRPVRVPGPRWILVGECRELHGHFRVVSRTFRFCLHAWWDKHLSMLTGRRDQYVGGLQPARPTPRDIGVKNTSSGPVRRGTTCKLEAAHSRVTV